MDKIKKSIAVNAIFKLFSIPLNLLSIAIISRLLTPEEIGIHVVATAIAAIATEIRMLGTGGYLIRKKELKTEDCQNVLGITIIICWCLGILLFSFSSVLAASFSIPDLEPTIKILTISFIFAPFISLTTAVLSREFKFKIIVILNFGVALVTFLASIGYIWLGYSYLSLALGLISGLMLKFLVLYFLRPKVMSWRPKLSNPKEVIKFGGFVSGASVFRRFTQSLPDLVIGKLGVAPQAAMFSRGMGLMDFTTKLIFNTVNPIVMPYLSDIKRTTGDNEQIKAFLKASNYYCSLVIPMSAVAGIAAYPAINLMFGTQWLDAVIVAKILAVWVCITSLKQFSNQLLITSNFEKVNFYINLVGFFITLVCCSIGFYNGIEGVALGLVCASFFELIIVLIYLKKIYALNFFTFILNQQKNLLITIICIVVTLAFDFIFKFETLPPIISAICLSVLMPLVWLIAIRSLKHDIYFDIVELLLKHKKK